MRHDTIESFRVAILAADGFDYDALMQIRQALKKAGAHPKTVSKFRGRNHERERAAGAGG